MKRLSCEIECLQELRVEFDEWLRSSAGTREIDAMPAATARGKRSDKR
jgi:hypothetical protein